MATGRILQFDHMRGYGFVAADDGGDDVFLHASVFDGDQDDLVPGAKLEFKVMAADRGRKAFAMRLTDEPEHGLVPAPRPVPPAQAAAGPAPGHDQEPGDKQLCDVLSSAELEQELTELLLSNIPSLTGQQVLEVRQSVLEAARKHGWVDM